MKIRIEFKHLLALWIDIINRYNEITGNKIPSDQIEYFKSNRYLITDKSSPRKDTQILEPIYTVIASDKAVLAYIKTFNEHTPERKKGKQLRPSILNEMFNFISSGGQDKTFSKLQGIHKDLFFRFVGCSDYTEYTDIKVQNFYTGLYYSKQKVVREFDISISLSKFGARCKMNGFHDKFPGMDFEGNGKKFGTFWIFKLNSKDGNTFANILFDVGADKLDPFTKNNFRASLLTIGSANEMLFCECMIIKHRDDKGQYDDDMSYAKRYLNLTRNHVMLDSFATRDFSNLDSIIIDGNKSFYNFRTLRNRTFTILNITPSNKICFAKMVVDQEFGCTVFYPRNDGMLPMKLSGTISAAKGHEARLLINIDHTHKLYTTTVVDATENENIFTGGYIVTPARPTSPVIIGEFKMFHDEVTTQNSIKFWNSKEQLLSHLDQVIKSTLDSDNKLLLSKMKKWVSGIEFS